MKKNQKWYLGFAIIMVIIAFVGCRAIAGVFIDLDAFSVTEQNVSPAPQITLTVPIPDPGNETVYADYGLFAQEGESVIRTLTGSATGFNINPEFEVNLPGIAWCGTTRTLILNNFSFETSAGVGLFLPSNSIIELIGTNIITGSFVGGRAINPNDIVTVLVNSNLTIQGSGSLTATSNFNGILGYGDITISGATVNAYGISTSAGSAGISAMGRDGRLIIRNGATVTSTSGAIGIRTRNGINLQSGTVTMTGNNRALLVSNDTRGFASISGDFAVPSGIVYWVNSAPVAPNPLGAGTRSNGNFIITASHRYLRLHR